MAVAYGDHVCLVFIHHYCVSLPALRLRDSVPLLHLSSCDKTRFPSRETIQSNVQQIRVNGLFIRHRSALVATAPTSNEINCKQQSK